jgi:energy-coupling factor transporter ATP-binding protein EcfA2
MFKLITPGAMLIPGATLVASGQKAILVSYPYDPTNKAMRKEIWVPRAAISVCSPIPLDVQGKRHPGVGIHIESWFLSDEGKESKLDPDIYRAMKPIESNVDIDLLTTHGKEKKKELPPLPTPTAEQTGVMNAVAEALETEQVAVVVGPAGTGKTTIMRLLAQHLRATLKRKDMVFLAPTGKAAIRLSEVTGYDTRTLHSFTYGGASEEDEKGNPIFRGAGENVNGGDDTIIFIDEGSMVGEKLVADFMASIHLNTRVVVFGDREQLEPVKDVWGFPLMEPTAALQTVHRQKEGSGILELATAIRENRPAELPEDGTVKVGRGTIYTAVQAYVDLRRSGEEVAFICALNTLRHEANQAVRIELGRTAPLEDGDRLLIRRNAWDFGLMNGHVVEVHNVKLLHEIDNPAIVRACADSDWTEGAYCFQIVGRKDSWFVVPAQLLMGTREQWYTWLKVNRPPRPIPAQYNSMEEFYRALKQFKLSRLLLDRVIECNYGEAITCHASQGSQYKHVVVYLDPSTQNNLTLPARHPACVSARRWWYTAVTRAQQNLSMTFAPVNVNQASDTGGSYED